MPSTPYTIDLDTLQKALATSALNHALYRIGDHWTLSIFLEAFLGVRQFDQFQARLGIPRQTLSLRLKSLIKLDILRAVPYQTRPVRMEYHLTRKGVGLYGTALACWDWERKWGKGMSRLPSTLTHRTCGKSFMPTFVCSDCHKPLDMHNATYALTAEGNWTEAIPERAKRSGGTTPERKSGDGSGDMHIVGLIADRWLLLIISSVLLGCHRFDQLQHVLNIGSSVLTNRLHTLCSFGLLEKIPDTDDARRIHYRLTPASHDLFNYIVTLSQWAREYQMGSPGSISIGHKTCGAHPVTMDVACSACHARVKASDVLFTPST